MTFSNGLYLRSFVSILLFSLSATWWYRTRIGPTFYVMILMGSSMLWAFVDMLCNAVMLHR